MTFEEIDILLEPYIPFGTHINELTEEERKFSAYYSRVRAVDRTKNLNQLKDYKIVSEIPTGLTKLTFAEIASEQALTIKTSTKSKYLLWSGGIDSTVAFYALVSQGVEFTVLIDEEAVSEYPLLAEKIEAGDFIGVGYIKSTILEPLAIETLSRNPEVLFITGEIGDQIFGSVLALNHTKEYRSTYYKDVVHEIKWKHLENTVAAVVDDLLTTTVAEWFWAVNFTCKYQDVQLRMIKGLEITPLTTNPNVVHFFDTPDFQRWAMQNYKSNADFSTLPQYKMVAKEYIFGFNGDAVYRDTKLKIESLRRNTYRIKDKIYPLQVNRRVEE